MNVARKCWTRKCQEDRRVGQFEWVSRLFVSPIPWNPHGQVLMRVADPGYDVEPPASEPGPTITGAHINELIRGTDAAMFPEDGISFTLESVEINVPEPPPGSPTPLIRWGLPDD
jgi:hypothetical protein